MRVVVRLVAKALAGRIMVPAFGLMALVAILATRQRFNHLFDDFALQRSRLTSLATGPFLPGVLGWFVGAAIVVDWLVPGTARQGRWNTVAFFGVVACLAVYVVGVFLPINELIRNLS